MKLLGLVLFTVLLVKGHSQLQCYTCTNCAKIPDNSLGSCETTTVAPPVTTPTAGPGTGSPSTASPSTASPSTASPSTASPSTASPSTASPSTASPSTASPSTASPSTASPSTASPTTASPSTASSATAGSSSPTTEGSTTVIPPEPAPISARSNESRSRRSVRADETWSCFYEEIKGANNAVSVNRGCTQNKEYCQTGGEKCRTCTKDKCNSSAALKLSLFTLFTTLVVVFSVFK